jgi:hypothetical protein
MSRRSWSIASTTRSSIAAGIDESRAASRSVICPRLRSMAMIAR